MFSCDYCEVFKNTYFKELLWMAVSGSLQQAFWKINGLKNYQENIQVEFCFWKTACYRFYRHKLNFNFPNSKNQFFKEFFLLLSILLNWASPKTTLKSPALLGLRNLDVKFLVIWFVSTKLFAVRLSVTAVTLKSKYVLL